MQLPFSLDAFNLHFLSLAVMFDIFGNRGIRLEKHLKGNKIRNVASEQDRLRNEVLVEHFN